MNRQELTAEFIRIERTPAAVLMHVADIRWPSPSEPETIWRQAKRLPAGVGEAEIHEAVAAILGNKRFFRECKKCGLLNPVGCMHDRTTCQGCATEILHVAY